MVLDTTLENVQNNVDDLKSSIATTCNVTADDINILEIYAGSVVVVFEILNSNFTSVEQVTATLQSAAQDGGALQAYSPTSVSVVVVATTLAPTTTVNPAAPQSARANGNDSERLRIVAIVVSVVFTVLIVAIIAAVLIFRHFKKRANRKRSRLARARGGRYDEFGIEDSERKAGPRPGFVEAADTFDAIFDGTQQQVEEDFSPLQQHETAVPSYVLAQYARENQASEIVRVHTEGQVQSIPGSPQRLRQHHDGLPEGRASPEWMRPSSRSGRASPHYNQLDEEEHMVDEV
jgi:hypothetical protein